MHTTKVSYTAKNLEEFLQKTEPEYVSQIRYDYKNRSKLPEKIYGKTSNGTKFVGKWTKEDGFKGVSYNKDGEFVQDVFSTESLIAKIF